MAKFDLSQKQSFQADHQDIVVGDQIVKKTRYTKFGADPSTGSSEEILTLILFMKFAFFL